MEVFGARLKQAREHLGWNQSELARRAGVPSAVLSRLESGARAGLTLEVARRLARALGVGIDSLAGTFDTKAEATPAEAALAGTPAPGARRRGRPRAAARSG